MATKKTLATYTKAVTKAKSKYNSAKTNLKKNTKELNKLNMELKAATSVVSKHKLSSMVKMASLSTKNATRAVTKAKKAYTKANNNLATFKKSLPAERRKATLKLKKDMIAQMQKDKPGYWANGRPFIIPKYPGSIKSYIFIQNNSESETIQTDITTNAISPGQYTNHFSQTSPVQRQFDGKIGGAQVSQVSDLKNQFDKLKRWSSRGTEVELHHGQRTSNSAVLSSVGINFDAPRDNAIPVSITMQDVKWAETMVKKSSKKTTSKKKGSNSGKKSPTKGSRKKAKPKAGKYLTIKKGDTYWGYHIKYGTSISKLRSWNGFPDRRLPIGKKVRVK